MTASNSIATLSFECEDTMTVESCLKEIGQRIHDASEGLFPLVARRRSVLRVVTETFVLVCNNRNSERDLGMIDASASSLDITVAGKDYALKQSPGLLASSREGGTTGAGTDKISIEEHRSKL